MTGIRVQACLHQQHQWASCTSVCFSLSSGFISSQSLGVLLNKDNQNEAKVRNEL